jgi:DNA-binding transcriptional LysR family regulator
MQWSSMDRLAAISAFVAVAELRGFAPAARRLRLSASIVTRHVAALEAHLGTRLLLRTTRTVTLTDAGALYLARARRVLADLAEADAAARAEQSVPSGRLVVAAPQVFGRMHVAPLVAAFLAQHPAVRGELTLADRRVNLLDEGVDVAVRIGALDDSTLTARAVGSTRRVVVASPDYLATHGEPLRPDDVARHRVIQCTALTPTPEWRLGHDEARRVALAPVFVTNSVEATVDHAERGGGLARVLAYQVADAVRAGRLRVVLADHESPALPIHVVFPAGRLLPAKVRAFVDLLTATCDWRFTAP